MSAARLEPIDDEDRVVEGLHCPAMENGVVEAGVARVLGDHEPFLEIGTDQARRRMRRPEEGAPGD